MGTKLAKMLILEDEFLLRNGRAGRLSNSPGVLFKTLIGRFWIQDALVVDEKIIGRQTKKSDDRCSSQGLCRKVTARLQSCN
jgi:hypothetical protein